MENGNNAPEVAPAKVVWVVQVLCIVALVALAWIDALTPDFEVGPEFLTVLGGIALGPELAKVIRK